MQQIPKITEKDWEQINPFNKFIYEDYFINNVELSDKTKKVYKSNLRIWFKWVFDNLNNKSQLEIKSLEFKRYQNWLLSLGHSSADIANKRAAVSSLNNYIILYYEEEYPTFHNFINAAIKKPEANFAYEKLPPTKEEIDKLIQKLEMSTIKNKYQKIAYIKFTWETGCRRAEVMQLKKNLIFAKPTRKIYEGKKVKYYTTPLIRCKGKGQTGKMRRFRFSDYSMDAFKKWLEERGEDDCPYMFVVKYDGEVKQVGETAFNNWCSKYFTPMLGRRVHPHALRESRATYLVKELGEDIKLAQKLLGHTSARTTEMYVIEEDEDSILDVLFIKE